MADHQAGEDAEEAVAGGVAGGVVGSNGDGVRVIIVLMHRVLTNLKSYPLVSARRKGKKVLGCRHFGEFCND